MSDNPQKTYAQVRDALQQKLTDMQIEMMQRNWPEDKLTQLAHDFRIELFDLIMDYKLEYFRENCPERFPKQS